MGVAPALEIFGDVFQRSTISARHAQRRRDAAQTSRRPDYRRIARFVFRRQGSFSACGRPRNGRRLRPDSRRDSIPRSCSGRARKCPAGRRRNSTAPSAGDSSAASAARRAAAYCRPAPACRDSARIAKMSSRTSLVKCGVGEGRVVVRSVRPHAKAHRTTKRLVAPSAKPGITVRRQVGGIDAAERRLDALCRRRTAWPGRRYGSFRSRRVRQRLALGDHFRRRGGGHLGAGLGLRWMQCTTPGR